MAWKAFTGKDDKDKKEGEVPDNPEKKVEVKPAEKTPAELIPESLKPITDAFGAMRAEIDALKVKTTPKEYPEIPSVMDDEDRAFNTRLTPIMAKTLEMEARLAKDDVEREYKKLGFGDLWDENRTEIDNF